jgi:hypothetical protein
MRTRSIYTRTQVPALEEGGVEEEALERVLHDVLPSYIPEDGEERVRPSSRSSTTLRR